MLRTYSVLVVMDQFTRQIVGFAVRRGVVDGLALCRMFNRAIRTQTLPKYLRTMRRHYCERRSTLLVSELTGFVADRR